MLKLTGIQKSFDGLPVLSNLSLTLSQGEIVALIGPSGCGKTTLLNIISELTTPDAGTVEGAEGKLSYMFQNARLLPWRTVEENIRLVREDAPGEEVRTLIAAVGLFRFRRTLDLLQASALADTLGLFLITAGLLVLCGFTVHSAKLILAAVILWTVNPVAAHLIARMEVLTGLELDPDQLPGEGEQEL